MMLVGPFLIPVPPLKGTFPPDELADDDSEFIEVNGLDIHVKKRGRGSRYSCSCMALQPVYTHGMQSWSRSASWERSSPMTAQGFGLSEHPLTWQGQNPYSAETQVELVIGLLDHYGVQQAILVGNSAGGTVAMQVALAHPERVSALVLVDPAVYHGGGAPDGCNRCLASPQMRRLGPLVTRQILSRGRDLIKLAWHDPDLLAPRDGGILSKAFQGRELG